MFKPRIRHPGEKEHGENPAQYTVARHDNPDRRRIESEVAEGNGCGEEYGLQSAERYVDECKEPVVDGGDEYVSLEKMVT